MGARRWRHEVAGLQLPKTTTGFLALLGLTAGEAARVFVRSSPSRSRLEAFVVFVLALLLLAGGVADAGLYSRLSRNL